MGKRIVSLSLSEIAAPVDGRIVGRHQRFVDEVVPVEEAAPHTLSFVKTLVAYETRATAGGRGTGVWL